MTIFEKIVAKEIPAYIIAENDDFLAFLDVFPLTTGHTLVIPKRCTDYIFDLPDEEYTNLYLFAKKISKALDKVIPSTKIAMSVIGLEVPHAHIHLVPITAISDLNFSSPRNKASEEDLVATANLIKSAL